MSGGAPASSPGRLRIGITVGLRTVDESLWTNGIKQNALFLALALGHCPNVASVTLVNTTGLALDGPLPWDATRWPTSDFEFAKDRLDVLIELGGQIDAAQTRYLKARGVRLVSYCCGFEYVHAMEAILFDRPGSGAALFVNRDYDDIWMVPQVATISGSYFSALRRRPARVVPFVWDPVLLEARSRSLVDGGVYAPREGARRLSVFEPNLDVVKFCLYPALIADLAHRQRPGAIALLQVTNAEGFALRSPEFIALMNQLDLVRERKAVFLGTHEVPVFLAERTDIVVSHQWDNPLNYLYLEVCWQGYPLVHNASLCPELGYAYSGHDLDHGARRLIEAVDHHDADAVSYRSRQRAHLARFRPGAQALTRHYAALLDRLTADMA